jgi:hypothetical protein
MCGTVAWLLLRRIIHVDCYQYLRTIGSDALEVIQDQSAVFLAQFKNHEGPFCHCRIFISGSTWDCIDASYKSSFIGDIELRGKSNPVRIYRVESC